MRERTGDGRVDVLVVLTRGYALRMKGGWEEETVGLKDRWSTLGCIYYCIQL
jgi:hypothetical protein